MSDTPTGNDVWPSAYIDPETALQLERELNEANADRLRLREALEQFHRPLAVSGNSQLCELIDAISETPPPPVVAKSDADALANALQELAQWYKENIGLPAVAANAALHSYRTKYPQ